MKAWETPVEPPSFTAVLDALDGLARMIWRIRGRGLLSTPDTLAAREAWRVLRAAGRR